MKRIIWLLICFIAIRANAQDVINVYVQKSGPPEEIRNFNSAYPFLHVTELSPTGNFDGEYEICVRDLFWWHAFSLHAISYQYEAVSFPFAPQCAFTGGCGFYCPNNVPPTGSDPRILTMPDLSNPLINYNSNTHTWHYPFHTYAILYGKTPLRKFYNIISSDDGQNNNPGHVLASNTFHIIPPNVTYGVSREMIPHTILKITINLHCDNTASEFNIVKSFSFVYDNTRGRMRFYPFYNNNCGNNSNSAVHDQIFLPQLLVNDSKDDYSSLTPPDIILPGNGTLNYFRFNEISNQGCISVTPPLLETDVFFSANPPYPPPEYTYAYVFPSPQTLITAPLRQGEGKLIAGYELNPQGNLQLLSTNALLRHQYEIDQNIDLNIINPVEKVIYNPSEANITADNLIFPSYYTFKTIRGLYPSTIEAGNDNTSGNGGPYTDLRDVPVTTDLSSENASDPANDPVYASRYYLKNGSKLTIQSCARLFDVAFDVEQGSTMIIEDYSQMIGQEDKSTNQGRYKIRGLGGAVLRNTAPVQYVQNGNITQTYPLYYTATDKIIAGAEVDTDLDAITGDYVLQPDADVTFHDNHIIRLKPGFRAKSGSRFTARCDNNVAQLPLCISNRIMSQGGVNETNQPGSGTPTLQLYPNPTTGMLNFARENREARPGKVEVFDGRGKLILEQIYSVSPLPQLDLSQQPDGIYLVKVTQGNDSRSAKVVLNRK